MKTYTKPATIKKTTMLNERIQNLVGKHGIDYCQLPEKLRLLLEDVSRQDEWSEKERKSYEALINNTDDLVWSLDREFRLIKANTAFITYISRRNGIDLVPGDFLLNMARYPDPVLKKWRSWYCRALEGETFRVELYTEVFATWAEIKFNPMIENDCIVGVSCYLNDITTKKMNEQQLRKREEMMSDAQRILHIGSWELYFDSNENVLAETLQMSDEIYRIFGYGPGEIAVTYDEFFTWVYPDDVELVKSALKDTFNGKADYSIEYRIVCRDKSIRWVKAKGDTIYDRESQMLVKMTGTVEDITERKQLELERVKMTTQLLQRNKDLQQFAYIISHNLRSPVANILGLSKLLEDENLDDAAKAECRRGLVTSTKRLDDVIFDLNRIIQIKDQAADQKETVVFSVLVSNIEESIQHIVQREGAVIRTDFKEVKEIFTVKNYLYSIFYNLISNSIKYRKPQVQPLLEITARIKEDKLVVIFKDNGMGMDMALYGNKVFGLYNRFHTHVEGKGMGLYMVKTQVEALGGIITIKSEVNMGTEITIEFENN